MPGTTGLVLPSSIVSPGAAAVVSAGLVVSAGAALTCVAVSVVVVSVEDDDSQAAKLSAAIPNTGRAISRREMNGFCMKEFFDVSNVSNKQLFVNRWL